MKLFIRWFKCLIPSQRFSSSYISFDTFFLQLSRQYNFMCVWFESKLMWVIFSWKLLIIQSLSFALIITLEFLVFLQETINHLKTTSRAEDSKQSLSEILMEDLLAFLGVPKANQTNSMLVSHVLELLTQCLDQLNAVKDKISSFRQGITDQSFQVFFHLKYFTSFFFSGMVRIYFLRPFGCLELRQSYRALILHKERRNVY